MDFIKWVLENNGNTFPTRSHDRHLRARLLSVRESALLPMLIRQDKRAPNFVTDVFESGLRGLERRGRVPPI